MTVTVMEWRVCPRFPAYEVSECGDLRCRFDTETRKKGWRHRGSVDYDGYLSYALLDAEGNRCAATAHVLVAEAFIGPKPSAKHEVAHGNGSRVFHHYSNLRWATRKENHRDIQVHGTSPARGEKNPNCKLTEQDVKDIRASHRRIKAKIEEGSISGLAKRYGVHIATISGIASGKIWSHIPFE